jgi:hypothetical protein
LKELPDYFKSDHTMLDSYQQFMKFLFSTSLPTLIIYFLSLSSCRAGGVAQGVESFPSKCTEFKPQYHKNYNHCHLNVNMSGISLWFWFVFPWWLMMLSIFSLHILFGEMSTCNFAHFKIGVFLLLICKNIYIYIGIIP